MSETLYYAFPDIHWQKIRTNNLLERIMRECLNLAAARLRYIAGIAWSTKRRKIVGILRRVRPFVLPASFVEEARMAKKRKRKYNPLLPQSLARRS